MTRTRLTVTDHDRGSVGMTYVYAVNSRRARGVSVGVNLNPNQACNWRCIYCQVPGLVAGKGAVVDLGELAAELDSLLTDVASGAFFDDRVPEDARQLRDVAFSGDGEPTTSPSFPAAVSTVIDRLEAHGLRGDVPITLITNGSMLDKPAVRAAVTQLLGAGGRIWFKLDRATAEGMATVNDRAIDVAHHLRRLRWAASAGETWIQTCVFGLDGEPPSEAEQEAYLDMVRSLARDAVPVRGVLLYGLARPSHQPEAPRLTALPAAWLEAFGARIEAAGLPVRISP